MALTNLRDGTPQGSDHTFATENEESVVLRRRRDDWNGGRRAGDEDVTSAAQRAAVSVAAATLAAYDGPTGGHSDDVVALCETIADDFDLPEPRRCVLLAAAQLHDIGKVAVPSAVLEKPGPLDAIEWQELRRHTLKGEQILLSVPELTEVARIVRHSHERYDGSGYPDGLAGEEIPFESRIVFCSDAFHAIRSDRPYRRGRSAAKSMLEIRKNAGTQFDPLVADALDRAARTLRRSKAKRMAAMTDGVRSRRLVALLLTLVVGGSAMAAPSSPLHGLLFGGDEGQAQASACADPCLPAQLGLVGQLPGADAPRPFARDTARGLAPPPKARGGTAEQTSPLGDAGPRARSGARAEASGSGRRGGVGLPGPGALPGALPIPVPPSLLDLEGGPSQAGGTPMPALPPLPARSDEAPRRPASPGKPTGPGPGRSDEAPGKPSVPGTFGNRSEPR